MGWRPRHRRRRSAVILALVILLGPTPVAHALDWRDVRLDAQSIAAAGTTFSVASLGEGPLIVLLSGTASPMSEWDPALLGALADGHRVVVFDYPGLGASGPAPRAWTFDHAASWTSDLIAALSPGQPVDVIGWSMGGFIAQRLAVRHPQQVRRLVLAATNPGGSDAVLGPRWVQEADSDGGVRGYLRSNYPPGARGAGRAFLERLAAAVDDGAYPPVIVPAHTARAMVRAEDPWLRSDANAVSLHRIVAPTLVITGAQDLVTPAVNSRRIARRIPDATVALLPGAGHSFLFQRPQETAHLITSFLDRGSG